jgi:DNA-binding NtrC family response regulator
MKARSARPDSPLDGVRVLLVEDHPVVREVIDRLLVGFGARVTAVAGVPEALEALPRARPNVHSRLSWLRLHGRTELWADRRHGPWRWRELS